MKKILITGATDGIGLLAAQKLSQSGHVVILHGRNPDKLKAAVDLMDGSSESHVADLTSLEDTASMARDILKSHTSIDVLINNAGVLKTQQPLTKEGRDVRFVVNTIAPYILTELIRPVIPSHGRILNVASAAQALVDLPALMGGHILDDMSAYSQSKLALIIWTQAMARSYPQGPQFVSINPGSLLATKMVREGFGIPGSDLNIGADILTRAALSDEFSDVSGQYFDNDSGQFAAPHVGATDAVHCEEVMSAIKAISDEYLI